MAKRKAEEQAAGGAKRKAKQPAAAPAEEEMVPFKNKEKVLLLCSRGVTFR